MPEEKDTEKEKKEYWVRRDILASSERRIRTIDIVQPPVDAGNAKTDEGYRLRGTHTVSKPASNATPSNGNYKKPSKRGTPAEASSIAKKLLGS